MLIVDYIQTGVLDKMNTEVQIVEAGPVINGLQIVRFNCMKWMKLFDTFYVNGGEVLIVNYLSNFVQIETPSPGLPVGTICNLKKPILLNGTLSNTKEEWNRFELDERSKLPFIWLVSPTKIETDDQNSPFVTAQIDLWFVHWSDWSKLNKDRQDETLRPLYSFINAFFKAIKKNKLSFIKYSNLVMNDFPKFGTQDKNGIDKVIFDSTLSAVSTGFRLEVRKKEKCC